MGDGMPHQGNSNSPGEEGVDNSGLDAGKALQVSRGHGSVFTSGSHRRVWRCWRAKNSLRQSAKK